MPHAAWRVACAACAACSVPCGVCRVPRAACRVSRAAWRVACAVRHVLCAMCMANCNSRHSALQHSCLETTVSFSSKTKKIMTGVMVFGYLILISIDFYVLISSFFSISQF